MDDRELLQAAAKAAGFGDKEGRFCWTESEYPPRSGHHGALWNFRGHMDTAELWNPLTDDGDALRLAVKLRMDVFRSWREGSELAVSATAQGAEEECYEIEGSDPYAATRRAIVRAAAALGSRGGDQEE